MPPLPRQRASDWMATLLCIIIDIILRKIQKWPNQVLTLYQRLSFQFLQCLWPELVNSGSVRDWQEAHMLVERFCLRLCLTAICAKCTVGMLHSASCSEAGQETFPNTAE